VLVIYGAILVALTTPLHLVLQLVAWNILATASDSNSPDGVLGLAAVLNVGLFLVLCGLAVLLSSLLTVAHQRTAVIAALILHLVIWLGLSLALAITWTMTGGWP
jgi:hypothetical protein